MPPASRACASGVAGLLLLAAGCTSAGTGEHGGTRPGAERAFGHVHGLGVNPADRRLYVASHLGVFRHGETGFRRVADRWQDTMAFTVVGPDHFLGSGHPDTREEKPIHLGLIESTDAAESWTPVSLEGKADFHSLEVAGDRLYGYDSRTQRLMYTEDRAAWTTLLAAPLLDVEADPADPTSLVLVGQRGTVMTLSVGGQLQVLEQAPALGILDWASPALLVGLAPSGQVWVSSDGGARWSEAGAVPGSPQALTTEAAVWYAASDHGLFASTDSGATWDAVPPG